MEVTGIVLMGAFGLLMLCDTLIGASILYKLFRKSKSNVNITEGFLTEE